MGTIGNELTSDGARGPSAGNGLVLVKALKALGTFCKWRAHYDLMPSFLQINNPDLLPFKVQILVMDDVKRRSRHGIDNRGKHDSKNEE